MCGFEIWSLHYCYFSHRKHPHLYSTTAKHRQGKGCTTQMKAVSQAATPHSCNIPGLLSSDVTIADHHSLVSLCLMGLLFQDDLKSLSTHWKHENTFNKKDRMMGTPMSTRDGFLQLSLFSGFKNLSKFHESSCKKSKYDNRSRNTTQGSRYSRKMFWSARIRMLSVMVEWPRLSNPQSLARERRNIT